ncbi:MAG: DUF3224 domain-containing protein [Bryobacteraceae bacterium]|nr:DUF3224 domain-containing protein [Bryobacteraceae bacterium]
MNHRFRSDSPDPVPGTFHPFHPFPSSFHPLEISQGQMLSAQGSVKGSAGFLVPNRVSGKLAGRDGPFVFQHTGTTNCGTPPRRTRPRYLGQRATDSGRIPNGLLAAVRVDGGFELA